MRLIDYFRRGAALDPARVAFQDHEKALTFGEVSRSVELIAGALHARGVPDCARIAVYSPNDAAAFACILAIARLGGVWLPVNARNPVAVSAGMLRTAGCTVLFFHSSLSEDVRRLKELVPGIATTICIDATKTGLGSSVGELESMRCDDAPEVADRPDRLVAIFPTGGTTGLSKAALLSNRVWEAATSAMWTCCPVKRGPPVHLVAAPMTHGAGGVALWMIPGGTTSIILKRAEPLAIMEAIARHRVTHLYLPPTVLYMMLAHPEVRTFDYGSLEYFILAAAPVAPDKLREAMEVFGPCMCQSFGQAEAPMFLTYLANGDLEQAIAGNRRERFASCGRPTLSCRVEIMGSDGQILEPGQRGEIVARGSLVFDGYFMNPAATESVSRFGWHHTGDVGYKDDDGYVYIVDRVKDMIITGGFNVFSAEVEQVLLGHAAVQDCAVVGSPDEKWGEAVTAVIELKPGAEVEAEALIDLVRQRLGSVQAPKRLEFWRELPRSHNGKVLKADIRRTFWEGHARAI